MTREPEVIDADDNVEVVQRVAAVDIAKASGKVCTRIPHPSVAGRRLTKIWDVGATTRAVMDLADELARQHIERVVVEATSDYWRPFVYLLEARGLLVWLVNAHDIKQVPGRPKTDKLDAVWLAKLNERGMLRPSFIPPMEIRQLRDYTRLRVDLVEDRTRFKQRIEKLLEDSLIKLSTVASDIFGKPGRTMLDALIAGQHDPEVLAEYALGKMRPKRAALKEALTGRFDAHHAELIAMLLDEVDALTAKIDTLTVRVDQLLADIPAACAPPPGPGGVDEGAAPLGAVARLDEITGIGIAAAQTAIAEVGLDMTQFPTAGHLVSWAKLSPRTIQSGTRRRSAKIGQDRQGQSLSQAGARRCRCVGGQDRHLPRRALPAAGQTPRQTQSDRRGGPLDPGHRLAPAGRPHRPFPRPGRRLLPASGQHPATHPQPHPPTRNPGSPRDSHPCGGLTATAVHPTVRHVGRPHTPSPNTACISHFRISHVKCVDK
ncbi:IS110 family RNA-guided transposase [Mycolicibacter icosiumassiliensis]|uniref:IS110 family transposase n=1 Tax=Mycolicibacter icosiumassiliensis TaxID=1792835 RepID=UPI000AFCFF9D|nr:IS110 family transposase [Mycolicibacter icosiumassiliensis]